METFQKLKALGFIKNKPKNCSNTTIQTEREVSSSNVCAVKEDINNKVSFCTYLVVDNWWCILVMIQDVTISATMLKKKKRA